MKMVLHIELSPEKLTAIEIALQQKNSTLQAEMQKYVEQLYIKIVAQAVKDFIDAKAELTKRVKVSGSLPRNNHSGRQSRPQFYEQKPIYAERGCKNDDFEISAL